MKLSMVLLQFVSIMVRARSDFSFHASSVRVAIVEKDDSHSVSMDSGGFGILPEMTS